MTAVILSARHIYLNTTNFRKGSEVVFSDSSVAARQHRKWPKTPHGPQYYFQYPNLKSYIIYHLCSAVVKSENTCWVSCQVIAFYKLPLLCGSKPNNSTTKSHYSVLNHPLYSSNLQSFLQVWALTHLVASSHSSLAEVLKLALLLFALLWVCLWQTSSPLCNALTGLWYHRPGTEHCISLFPSYYIFYLTPSFIEAWEFTHWFMKTI